MASTFPPGGTFPAPRSLRWASRTYAEGPGVLIGRPGRLFYCRMVMQSTGSAQQLAALRDDVTATAGAGLLLLVLDAGDRAPDDWPRIPVAMPFQHGLKVEWLGTAAAAIFVGWDAD
jgi:hypothetical protein